MPEPLNYRPSASAIYYTPERQFLLLPTLGAFAAAIVLGAVGSIVYALLQPNMNSPLLRGGAVIAAALAVGWLGLLPVKYGKIRLPALAATLGTILALFCLYFMWLVWLGRLVQRGNLHIGYGQLILHPSILIRLIQVVYEKGTWSYHGEMVNGATLLIWWLIEAGLIVTGGITLPRQKVLTTNPACLQCGRECTLVDDMPRFAADGESEFVASIEAREFTAFAMHPAPLHPHTPELVVRLFCCRACHQTNVLTINRRTWKKQGKHMMAKSTPLVNQLMVTPDEAEQIVMICQAIRDVRAEKKLRA